MARESYLAAQTAIYKAIADVIKDSEDFAPGPRAEVLRDVAYAFRLTAGGPQPGSVEVEAK